MAAVGAGHVIVVGEVAAYAGGDGLLADVQVGGSDDPLADVRLDGFLEPADLAHGGVEVNGLLRGQWCAHDVRASYVPWFVSCWMWAARGPVPTCAGPCAGIVAAWPSPAWSV